MTESVRILAKEETLFGISSALIACANGETVVDSETGEMFDQFDAGAMDALQARFDDKVTACVIVRDRKNAEADALIARSRMLADRANTLKKHAKDLEAYMRDSMVAAGVHKVETDTCRVSLRKPSRHLEVLDESAVPERFVVTKTSIDKRGATAALKAGEDVPGCALVDGDWGLAVK